MDKEYTLDRVLKRSPKEQDNYERPGSMLLRGVLPFSRYAEQTDVDGNVIKPGIIYAHVKGIDETGNIIPSTIDAISKDGEIKSEGVVVTIDPFPCAQNPKIRKIGEVSISQGIAQISLTHF